MDPFSFVGGNKRYHTWNDALRRRYGQKVCKIPLNAGFGCPNRDGTCGTGGCTYCSGQKSGDFGGDPSLSLESQFHQMKAVFEKKWPGSRYIAYFQAGTNTYAPVDVLRETFEPVLAFPGVVGLAVATRADCLPDPILCYLEDLSCRTDLTVELGLQTIHDETARRIGRGHDYETFLRGYRALADCGIPVCVHLINGLPGETREMMLQSVRQVAALRPYAVKIHLLHLLRGTPLADEYQSAPFPLLEKEEYVQLVCDQLELLPAETIIQRLTGDGDRRSLIGPMWSGRKREVLNAIDREMERRGTVQGIRFRPDPPCKKEVDF